MNKDFSYYLSKFLKDYLVIERNVSKNTIRSYTKTFQLLIDYLVNIEDIKLSNINFNTITRNIIINFLNHLEENSNTIRTRNQRLAAIKSFYQYCLSYETQNIYNIKQVLSIKSKKYVKPIQDYLTEEELETLFNSVDTSTSKGLRNLAILVLLYDTAARANEIINLKAEDLRLEEKLVILTGKGNKQRVVPIMENTKEILLKYINYQCHYSKYLFEKDNKKFNERFIRDIIKKYSSDTTKKVTPHTFRRSRAIHLLDKGVNIMYIKKLLDHESVITTEEYAKVLEKSKFEAIKKANPNIRVEHLEDWNDDQDLLNQLLNL